MDIFGFTPSELQHWVISLKLTWDIQEGNNLSRIRARTGGAVFSQTKVLVEASIPFFLSTACHRADGLIHI